MNSVTLVGRLIADPEIKELNGGTKTTTITLAISRNYKNIDGEYEADFIKCVLWNGVAEATSDYCHKGDVVAVKGKLQTRSYETESKEKKYVQEVVAEKVTFISSINKNRNSREER